MVGCGGEKKKKPARKKKTTPRKRALTIAKIASGIGVSTTTIDKYVKRGCPRTSIEAVNKWRSENIKAVAEDAEPNEVMLEIRRAEMAERWENAKTRQLKNAKEQGRLIEKDEVRRDLSVAASRLSNRLNALGTQCANLCPSELKPAIKQAVENCVRLALKELSEEFSKHQ